MIKLKCKLIKLTSLMIIFSAVIIILGYGIYNNSNSIIEVSKGSLDVSKYSFSTQGRINLDGEWEFYWNKFLTYKDFSKSNIKPNIFVEVPSTWNNYKIDNSNLPREGIATYRLRIKTNLIKGTLLSLRVDNLSSAYSLYINEKKIASKGIIGESSKQEIPEIKPTTSVFIVPAKEFDIIIHVSNFHQASGGFLTSIEMGSIPCIIKYHTKLIIKEWLLIGVLVGISIISFYNVLLKNQRKQNLYFTIMSLIMAVVVDYTGQVNVFYGLQSIDFMLFMKVWYFLATWLPFLLVLFVNEIYEIKYPKGIIKLFFVFTLVYSICYIFLPIKITLRFILVEEIFLILEMLSTIVITLVAIKNKNKNALLYIMALSFLIIAYVFDSILYYSRSVNSEFGEILNVGVFVFIAIQAIIQSRILNNVHIEKHQMMEKENELIESTRKAEIAFLQAQIKPHFLYNALNTIGSFCITDGEKAATLICDLSSYLRSSFDFENLEEKISLLKEMEIIKAYLAIEKARYGDRLQIEYLIDDKISLSIPHLIIQPLVENAVKHGIVNRKKGGKITIVVKREASNVLISVKDDGKGMSEDKIYEILKDGAKTSSVAIKNINTRLKRYYNQALIFESVEGEGTTVTVIIPDKIKSV